MSTCPECEDDCLKCSCPKGTRVEAAKEATLHLGYLGRMVSASKSSYSDRHPDHVVVFNCNVVSKNNGKIWYGDLDLTLDERKLTDLSKMINDKVYVLREMDARFEYEDKPRFERAVVIFDRGEVIIGEEYRERLFLDESGKLKEPCVIKKKT